LIQRSSIAAIVITMLMAWYPSRGAGATTDPAASADPPMFVFHACLLIERAPVADSVSIVS
jgi:hypothetical protein